MSMKMRIRVPQRDASGRLVESLTRWRAEDGLCPIRRDEYHYDYERALLRLRGPRRVGWLAEYRFGTGPGPGEVVCDEYPMIVDCLSGAMHEIFEGTVDIHHASVGRGGALDVCSVGGG